MMVASYRVCVFVVAISIAIAIAIVTMNHPTMCTSTVAIIDVYVLLS